MAESIRENKTVRGSGSGSGERVLSSGLESRERRTAIRKIALGTAALAGTSLLPDKWTTPLVEFGVLPAHATTSGTVEAPGAGGVCGTNFSLLFQMTDQSCASCGIWFDSAELEIVYAGGTFKKSQKGSLLIKKSPYSEGRFTADIGSIPCSAAIQSATLNMRLNRDEGIANSDKGSVISVYDYASGKKGSLVRTITAANDIKGRGYSKAKPVVPIDFTEYARKIHGK